MWAMCGLLTVENTIMSILLHIRVGTYGQCIYLRISYINAYMGIAKRDLACFQSVSWPALPPAFSQSRSTTSNSIDCNYATHAMFISSASQVLCLEAFLGIISL